MSAGLALLPGAVERMDCAVTTLGTLAADLNGSDDEATIAAIRWLFGVLREEVQNVRETVELLDTALKGSEVQP
jgi:hypothetical protein